MDEGYMHIPGLWALLDLKINKDYNSYWCVGIDKSVLWQSRERLTVGCGQLLGNTMVTPFF